MPCQRPSITDLTASYGKGHVFVITRCFLDGANKADSVEYDYLTLASMTGTKKQWGNFDKAWRRVLAKYHAEYLHVTDAIGFQRDFSRDKGWNKTKRDDFIGDCAKVYGEHIARPVDGQYPRGVYGLFPHTVTVNLKDLVRARTEHPDIPKNANEICASQSLGACLDWTTKVIKGECLHLIYDRSEPFKGHICDMVYNRKVRNDLPRLSIVRAIGEQNMRDYPGLQAVDLLGWSVSHQWERNHLPWQGKMLNHPHWDEILNYENLITPIAYATELRKKWNLSKRALHR